MASVFARSLLAVSRTCFLRRAVNLKSLARYKLQRTPRYMSSISSKIQVHGVEIHYEVAGQSNHVVLCLPGALGSTQSDFGPQLKGLKNEFTVITFDPRGYGKSIPATRDFPGVWSYEARYLSIISVEPGKNKVWLQSQQRGNGGRKKSTWLLKSNENREN